MTRHLYAMYCLLRRELDASSGVSSPRAPSPNTAPPPVVANGEAEKTKKTLPTIFTDPGYATLGTSILSTSNCGNPALRLFGFGPVAADGFGIGYIIKDDAISITATSKHLQTQRLLATISGYLTEVQKMVVSLHRAANERVGSFVDHSGTLRDVRTGKAIVMAPLEEEEDTVDGAPDADDAEAFSKHLVFYILHHRKH